LQSCKRGKNHKKKVGIKTAAREHDNKKLNKRKIRKPSQGKCTELGAVKMVHKLARQMMMKPESRGINYNV